MSTHLRCSFCGKGKNDVRKFISGPSVYICDECVILCNEILADDFVRQCACCRFWESRACHRHPPTMGLGFSGWPATASHDVCGEFAPHRAAASNEAESGTVAMVSRAPDKPGESATRAADDTNTLNHDAATISVSAGRD